MNIHHLKRLAGIREAAIQVDDPDEEDRLDDERRQREHQIKRLITLAFKRINLDIAEDGIFYDEANGREAIITLDDNQVSLDLLVKLKTTGLANSYVIWATQKQNFADLLVMFSVEPNLDYAVV